MKCDVCGQPIGMPLRITEVDELGNKTSRIVCSQHRAEFTKPFEDPARLFLPIFRSLTSFIRENQRMPTENEFAKHGLTGKISNSQYGTKEFDDQLNYFDQLVEFIDENDRLPTDAEIADPF